MKHGLAVALVAVLLASNAGAEPKPGLYAFGYDLRPDFRKFDPTYPEKKDHFSKELDVLQADMIAQQRKGRKTFCTRQLFLECRWLVYRTADFARTERRLNDFRQMLAL